MICKNCNREHPSDQIANPHYCISRLQEDLESMTASRDYWHREWSELNAAELKAEKRVKELTAELERKTELYQRVTDAFAAEVGSMAAQVERLLHACKYAFSYFQAEKEGGADFDRKAYLLLEDAIAQAAQEAEHEH